MRNKILCIYIYTPEGLGAIVTKTGGSYSISYVHTDHLGSPRVISNGAKAVLARYSYDAWGKRTLVAGANITNRGFTGHEHIDKLGLINMNARLYDPALGRFLSPDPYVQAPDFTQNFNRYSYALNNPLSYTDPTGEKWWHWVLGIADLLGGGALSATALLTTHNVSSLGIGLAGIASTIPVTPGLLSSTVGGVGLHTAGAAAGIGIGNGVANTVLAAGGSIFNGNFGTRVGNAWKLSWGMFKTDKSLNFAQRYWQFMSRYTYEMPVTAFGEAWNGLANAFSSGDVNVGYFHGATVLQAEWMNNWGAITVGSNITIGYDDGGIDAGNLTLLHEYGHYLQTRRYGAIPWLNMAISSISTPVGMAHMANWTEQDANYRSMRYFKNKITPEQHNEFLTDTHYAGYFKSYNYRFWFSYLFSVELISDFWWR